MTLAHAAAMHFGGSREAAKKRVQKLKAAGFIGERSRKVYEPSILFLTRRGFELLHGRGMLQDFPRMTWPSLERRLQVSELTLWHELAVLDVKAAISSAVQKEAAYDITEFSTWPALMEFTASVGTMTEVLVRPDGFLRIREQAADGIFEHTFYLELDRSTETLDTLARKALCYLNHYQTGGLALRFGHDHSEYRDFPFRVLMVFKTAERRNNAAERLLTQNPPILTQVWLSTLDEVKENPLGPVWIRPRDFRTAVAGTIYAVGQSGRQMVYCRQAERDRFIEKAVMKVKLLDGETTGSAGH